jgi:uncharacterized membrane protein
MPKESPEKLSSNRSPSQHQPLSRPSATLSDPMHEKAMTVTMIGLCGFIVASTFANPARPALLWAMLAAALVMAIGAVMLILSWFTKH